VTDDALELLRLRIQRLHRQNGEPTRRGIAKRTESQISHATVQRLLKCEELPKWGVLEPLVLALGGDVDEIRKLWVAVRDKEDPPEQATPVIGAGRADDSEVLEFRDRRPLDTLAEVDAADEDLNERSQTQEREEASLRDELAGAREKLADLGDVINDLHGQVGQLRQLVHEDRTLRLELKAQVAELEAERNMLRAQIEELRDRIRRSREDRIELLEERLEVATQRSEINWAWARSEEEQRLRTEAARHEPPVTP
jgi:hypothetical protein